MNIKNRTIFQEDNLHILRRIDSESIDLIYLDPPFNSNKNYSAPIGGKEAEVAFKDTWTLSDVDDAWHGEIADREPALYSAIQAAELTHSKNMKSYLIMMGVRLLEMRRILKDTGSIYLHCDPTANSYLRMLMDAVFGKDNFQNEIVWKRTGAKNDANRRGRIYDVILFYSKKTKPKWNTVYEPHDENHIKNYRHKDAHGQYALFDITRGGSSESESGEIWRGINPTELGKTWVAPRDRGYAKYIEEKFIPNYTKIESVHERLDALDNANLIYFPKKGILPKVKYYLSGNPGRTLQDMILNISNARGKERAGRYPTQKPLALLEQIIESSSNPGDIVLDPFCGTGTTCIAAEKLGRQWIGIDLGGKAVSVVKMRLKKDLGLDETDGILGKVIYRNDIPRLSEKLPNYRTHKHTLFGKQEGLCNGCNTYFPFKNMTVDHIVPQTKGGTDHPENLQILCNHCNSVKGKGTHQELIIKLKEDGII